MTHDFLTSQQARRVSQGRRINEVPQEIIIDQGLPSAVVRDQQLDRDGQAAFAERWGPLEHHPFFKRVEQTPDQPTDRPHVVRLAKGEPVFSFDRRHFGAEGFRIYGDAEAPA